MPYSSIAVAKTAGFPTSAEDIPISLVQINKLASLYDAIKEAGTAKNPIAVAWAQWKELYEIKGDKWIKRKKTESMTSMISTIPEVKDNSITVAFVKDGTIGRNNTGKKFTITSEALENDHATWLGGKVSANHIVNETGIISETWYKKPYAYAVITGLSDEVMSIVQSPAYRGVSQESNWITSDKKGNITKLNGTGITLVFYPGKPACDIGAGCGELIASTETDDESNTYINTQKSNSELQSTRGTQIMKDETDKGALEALKSENEALKTKSTAFDSELASKDTEITSLKSQIDEPGKLTAEIIELKSTIKDKDTQIAKSATDLGTAIKSALEAHDSANVEKLAFDTAVTELKSVMKDDTSTEFMETKPSTAQIMSMVKALKSASNAQVGAGSGGDINSGEKTVDEQIQSMGIPSIEFNEGGS